MWKSREAFEKSTFFKRLKLQGFETLEGLWPELEKKALRQKRIFRLNPLRKAKIEDFRAEGFKIGAELESFPNVFDFDLLENNRFSQHPFWGAGLGYVQDPVALEIIRDLEIANGHCVLDLCAAPGGKSTRIAELMGPDGYLVSNDSDLKRARILSGNLIRHGVVRSSVFSKEGAALAAIFPNTFDRILMDVPCSGESLFFKRDEKRRDVYESEVQELAQLQLQLILAAATSLRPGGRLLYSTCTYNITENEEVIRRFLRQNSDFELVKQERRWPHLHATAGAIGPY
ncbi:MAG: RsmB/NOP family class I SAM-dependent RNA methyltransferase [Bdellovibrionota bacterium]